MSALDELDGFATAGAFPPRVRRYSGGPVECIAGWDGPETRAHLLRATGRATDGHVSILLECCAIVRYTPCGAWIDTWEGERFVNLRAGKQWASATEDEALAQLHFRKRSQVRILGGRLAEAEEVLAALDDMRGKLPAPRRYHPSDYDYL